MELRWSEWEQCRASSSLETRWTAVSTLVKHLDDHLILVAERRLMDEDSPITPARLTVFRAKDTPLYALVTTDGYLSVGRCHDLTAAPPQELTGFDRLTDEVLALAVSGVQRWLGDHLDLWVVLRRHMPEDPRTPTLVYHGVVWLHEGSPRVRPVRDDQELADPERWLAQPGDRLPDWLRRYPLTFSHDQDPFTGFPEALVREDPGDIRAMTWSGDHLCYVGEDELRISGTPPLLLALPEPARALALISAPAGGIRGLVGCADRRLIAFQAQGGAIQVAWSQRLTGFSLALGILPPQSESEAAWPDLLTAAQDGWLRRWRYVGRQGMRDAWDRAWQALDLTDPDRLIPAYTNNASSPEQRRAATLWAAVNSVLTTVSDARPEQQDLWLQRLSELFQTDDQGSYPVRPALRLLLAELRAFAENPQPSQSFRGADFLPALVLRIYQERLPIRERQHVDDLVRRCTWSPQAERDPAARELRRRAQLTQDRSWNTQRVSSPEQRIERAYLGLARWANGHVAADCRPLRPQQFPDRPLLDLLGLGAGSARRLLSLTAAGPAWHRVAADGALTPEPEAATPNSGFEFQAGVRVPGTSGDHLVLVDKRGCFHCLGVVAPPHSQIPVTGPHPGHAWLLASCVHRTWGNLVVAIVHQGNRPQFLVGRLRNQTMELWDLGPLTLPRVGALDLAPNPDGGYRLLVGPAQAAPVYLLQMDESGRLQGQPRPLGTMQSGTSAIRLDDQGTRVLVGEWNGLLWCLNLDGTEDLGWTYRMNGAVRAIACTRSGDEPHFWVGAETGTLNLLRATDGRRTWRERLPEPIRQLVVLDGGILAAGMTGGLVSMYRPLSSAERRQALDQVATQLAELSPWPPETEPEVWRQGKAPQVEALFRLLRGDDLLGLIRRYRDRKTRVRLLRYWVLERGTIPDQSAAIVPTLKMRELPYLMAYLPDQQTAWDSLIWTRLQNLGRSNELTRSEEVAMAAYLRRLGMTRPPVAHLIDNPPRDRYFSSPWVSVTYIDLLAKAIRREMGRDHAPVTEFFGRLASALFRLHPRLARKAFLVFAPDSERALDCQALAGFLGGLAHKPPPAHWGEHLQRLRERLCGQPRAADWQRLLCAVLALEGVPRVTEASPWAEVREKAMGALRALANASYQFGTIKAPIVTALIEGLRALLPREPVLPDSETLEDRERAIEHSLRHPDRARKTPGPQTNDHPWGPYLQGLLTRTQQQAHDLLLKELNHVRQLVRPRLSLPGLDRDDSGRLRLRVRLDPEGWRQLEDVTIQVRLGGPGGLLPPGDLAGQLAFSTYPGRFASKELEFVGYLHPGQDQVSLEVSLRDGQGPQMREFWTFPVPAAAPRSGVLTLPGVLPRAYAQFRQTLFEVQDPVSLVIFDHDMGRDIFISDWDLARPGRRLDLDGATRDTGEGRRYGERRLDLALIAAAMAEVARQTHGVGRPGPLLVAPADQFVQRLLDGEAPQLLEAWWASLLERAGRQESPPWLLLVSSSHACRLRRLSPVPIPERPAHRLPEAQAAAELLATVMAEARLKEAEAKRCIRRLGADLRLVLDWLRWLKQHPSPPELNAYLAQKRIAELLRSELRSLSALDLINALLGAEAETNLRLVEAVPGQTAAQDCNSTVRRDTNQPKHLVARGEILTAEDLDRLRSDRQPPSHLRVQGFGSRGTPEAPRSQFLGLAQYRGAAEREASFQRLVERGMGCWIGGIFRTDPPYRMKGTSPSRGCGGSRRRQRVP